MTHKDNAKKEKKEKKKSKFMKFALIQLICMHLADRTVVSSVFLFGNFSRKSTFGKHFM